MCGIVGIWNHDGEPADVEVLRGMMTTIGHRGPDDDGEWTSGSMGLGHVRLSIIDLSRRGRQPFVTSDGDGILAYNGEVYNFRALRQKLESEGIEFRSTTDSEVVLYALHVWGPERAVPLFNGMFGFVYVDLRTRSMWVGRDRLGIKPLYVARVGNTSVVASEMKALLAHPLITGRPDMHALTTKVLCVRLEGAWTPFEDMRAVEPGTIERLSNGTAERTVYFDVIRDVDVDLILEQSRVSDETQARTFARLFAESVRMHLVSDAPLATACSGGIDSSLITAVAKDHKPQVIGYVADVKGTVSEGAAARLVGEHLGVQIRQVDVGIDDYLRLWPLAAWYTEQPSAHPSDPPFLAVTRACRHDGIKVLLTGEGADELFGGYEWQRMAYSMWRRRRQHAKVLRVLGIRKLGRLGRLAAYLVPFDSCLLERTPFSYSGLRAAEAGRDVLFTQQSLGHLLQASVVHADQRVLRDEACFRKLQSVEPIEDRAFLARCLLDLYGYLQNLLHRNDRLGMAASIESRVPFLENELVHFGMHLPRRTKFRDGTDKWVVRSLANSRLPAVRARAPKQGFAVPTRNWYPALGILENGVVPDLFKWSAAAHEHLVARIREAPRMVYDIVSLELWARIYLRGESPDALGEHLVQLNHQGQNKKSA